MQNAVSGVSRDEIFRTNPHQGHMLRPPQRSMMQLRSMPAARRAPKTSPRPIQVQSTTGNWHPRTAQHSYHDHNNSIVPACTPAWLGYVHLGKATLQRHAPRAQCNLLAPCVNHASSSAFGRSRCSPKGTNPKGPREPTWNGRRESPKTPADTPKGTQH